MLSDAIRILYPSAKSGMDFTVTDLGAGPYISFWNTATLGPQPSRLVLDPAIEQANRNHDQRRLDMNIDKLWRAAHDYEYAQISGSAIGLLTLGVTKGRGKSMAVQVWIKSIWNLYYERKATVTKDFVPSLDFSSCGPIPYSIPELMVEAG